MICKKCGKVNESSYKLCRECYEFRRMSINVTTGGFLLLSPLIGMPLAKILFNPISTFSLKFLLIAIYGLMSMIVGAYLLEKSNHK